MYRLKLIGEIAINGYSVVADSLKVSRPLPYMIEQECRGKSSLIFDGDS